MVEPNRSRPISAWLGVVGVVVRMLGRRRPGGAEGGARWNDASPHGVRRTHTLGSNFKRAAPYLKVALFFLLPLLLVFLLVHFNVLGPNNTPCEFRQAPRDC